MPGIFAPGFEWMRKSTTVPNCPNMIFSSSSVAWCGTFPKNSWWLSLYWFALLDLRSAIFIYAHGQRRLIIYFSSKKNMESAKKFVAFCLTSNWAGSCWLWSWVQWVCCVCGSSRVHRWIRYKVDASAEIVRFEELSVGFWLVRNCFWR